MHYIKRLNENYYIYVILIFVFIPLNFLPQLFDGVLIDYVYKTQNIETLSIWYKDASRHFHLLFIYLIDFLSKITSLQAEIFIDNLSVIFLILFCFEIKKYSKFLFGLNDKWANLSALFASIFPVWHTLVAFNIGQYLISFYFLLFGYRQFISKKKFNSILGLIFIILSFNVESSLCFVIGISFVHLILNKNSNFLTRKFITVVIISILYFFLRATIFPPSGYVYEGYNEVTYSLIIDNLLSIKSLKNIFNFSTFFTYVWLILIFTLHLAIINNKDFFKVKFNFIKINFLKYIKNYILLIILSGFAIFPYLLSNKSATVFYVSDYFQRHAFLLAPIFGMFFALMFKDMSRINCLKKKINLNYYILFFICINLIILNYGNYRKIESYLFRSNLVNEFKNYGSIPKGNIELIGSNMPAELRLMEVQHILFQSYDMTGWWTRRIAYSLSDYSRFKNLPDELLNNKVYMKLHLASGYVNECNTYIYLKNDLKKIDRMKKLYIFNHQKYYNIGKIEKNC